VHGLGVNPDFGMIGALRGTLAEKGFVTLSVQMPVLAADAPSDDYPATFPEAGNRIAAAVAYLRSRGATKVAVVAHSMGAAMTNAYLATPGAPAIDAWVPVGMPVDFAVAPKEPVLDVSAEKELPQVAAAAPLRARRLPKDAGSRQVTIPGADHYFDAQARQQQLAAAIAAFLDRVFAGRC
jgi:pimeloyl-ACP methyl ester carboxylesterase